jgi:hypothetical protein
MQLANFGAKVVINYSSNLTAAHQLVEEIKRNGGEAIAIRPMSARLPRFNHYFKKH